MNKQSFDLNWEYTEASGFAALFNPSAWRPVTLPHDAMIAKPRAANNPTGKGGAYFPGGVANYRKKFYVPEEWRGQSVQLEFEGVYMNAEVSVNNQLLCIQPYGYSSFIVDITPYLVYGQDNTVGVVANNTAQPNCRWYSGTGIYRHVWLRIGGRVHIQPWGVFVTTPVAEVEASVVQVTTELASLSGSLTGAMLRMRSTITDAQGQTVARVEAPVRLLSIQQTLLVKGAKLWSVDEPNLYNLLSEVLVDGSVVDTETTTFGIRSITVDAQNGFRLNGVPMKLKGGCIHHDHGPLGAASYDRAEERKVELLKSAGYNALRSAHNPPAPALLDACDHLYFQDWWQRDTAAIVKRDRNHPSVIMWSIGNEIFEALGNPIGALWSQRQADYIRSLDSTRFITSGVMFNFLEDIASGDIGGSFKLKPPPADPHKDSWALQTAPFITVLDPQHHGKPMGFTPWAWEPVLDTWTFPGQEGQVTQVDVYSIDEEVEVLVNGVSAGRKAAGATCQNKVSFDVLYQPGTIEAVGYTGGKETGRHRLVTASEPAALSLSADRAVIKAGCSDLAYVTIEVQDGNGTMVQHGEPLIGVEVTGAGELIAIGSGNPLSDEMYVGNQHKAYHGRLLAIVRSTAQAGAITLTARTEGLPAASIELQAR